MFLSSGGELGRQGIGNERRDGLEDSFINLFLRFARRLELPFRHAQGMIAALDNVQKVWRFHLGSDAL